MNKTLLSSIVVVFLGVVALAALLAGGSSNDQANVAGISASGSDKVVLYRDPNCGCCSVYGQYLKKEGFDVETVLETNMEAVKDRLGVPHELMSCHTIEIGGYVVEGHVPIEVIDELLTEKPSIEGIALPGMPSGSPGMPGPKDGPFEIMTLAGEPYMSF